MNAPIITADFEFCEFRSSRPEAGAAKGDSTGVPERILTPKQAAEEYARTWVRRRWAMLYSSLDAGPGRF